MLYSETRALGLLAKITDPVQDTDIISAGRLANLDFKAGKIQAVLQIPRDKADDFFPIRAAMQAALESFEDVKQADVILSAHKSAPNIKPNLNSDMAPNRRSGNPHQARRPEGYQGDSGIKSVIAISSAKGGVGKSTLAVNLAAAMARQGIKTGVLDADIHGPSLPLLMGLSGQIAKTKPMQGRRLITPLQAHGLKLMSIGFLTPDDAPIIWRGPLVQGAITRMLWDVDWGELDILLIDMPPGTGDAQLGLAQDIKPAGAVIISTPQDLALLDARKGAAMFQKVDIPILGLIENMALFTCPDCGNTHHIFGTGGAKRDAKLLNIPYLGAAPLHIDIRLSCDQGRPIALDDGEIANIFDALAKNLI